mgnify:CR=1 FL=1
MSNDDKDMDDWEAAMAEQAAAEDEESDKKKKAANHSGMDGVKTAELEELNDDDDVSDDDKRKLDAILDIPVTISMEVGRSQISIRNLLQLNQGSVVELERVAGEPLDVLVNGTLIAHGEVVVVNDKFGIRLTDVISQIERIRKLR